MARLARPERALLVREDFFAVVGLRGLRDILALVDLRGLRDLCDFAAFMLSTSEG
ncbi:MAG TPA: hypothetical protein VGF45_07920 [Polyangia bacterium]